MRAACFVVLLGTATASTPASPLNRLARAERQVAQLRDQIAAEPSDLETPSSTNRTIASLDEILDTLRGSDMTKAVQDPRATRRAFALAADADDDCTDDNAITAVAYDDITTGITEHDSVDISIAADITFTDEIAIPAAKSVLIHSGKCVGETVYTLSGDSKYRLFSVAEGGTLRFYKVDHRAGAMWRALLPSPLSRARALVALFHTRAIPRVR